jgi:hypothetical protein
MCLTNVCRPTAHFVRGVGGAHTEPGAGGSKNSNGVGAAAAGSRLELLDLEWLELGGLRYSQVCVQRCCLRRFLH